MKNTSLATATATFRKDLKKFGASPIRKGVPIDEIQEWVRKDAQGLVKKRLESFSESCSFDLLFSKEFNNHLFFSWFSVFHPKENWGAPTDVPPGFFQEMFAGGDRVNTPVLAILLSGYVAGGALEKRIDNPSSEGEVLQGVAATVHVMIAAKKMVSFRPSVPDAPIHTPVEQTLLEFWLFSPAKRIAFYEKLLSKQAPDSKKLVAEALIDAEELKLFSEEDASPEDFLSIKESIQRLL